MTGNSLVDMYERNDNFAPTGTICEDCDCEGKHKCRYCKVEIDEQECSENHGLCQECNEWERNDA